ncbi:MAG: hypothetical protein ABF628_00645 [Acetobacter orientalis]|uniref:hypothetical protein n=1 Tax=Acetobacter orientalis TaxID=146474 RepID=UPI0039E8260B
MSKISRRSLMRTSSLGLGLALLTACTVTTQNGVTTITLDVTKIKNYGQAGLNAAATVGSFLGGFPTLAPYAAVIELADTALSGALAAFSTAAGSMLVITYNDASWKTRIDSVLADLNKVASAIEGAISGSGSVLSAKVLAEAKTYKNALATIISVFQALLGVSDAPAQASTAMTRAMIRTGAPHPVTGMTEAQALKVLGV